MKVELFIFSVLQAEKFLRLGHKQLRGISVRSSAILWVRQPGLQTGQHCRQPGELRGVSQHQSLRLRDRHGALQQGRADPGRAGPGHYQHHRVGGGGRSPNQSFSMTALSIWMFLFFPNESILM